MSEKLLHRQHERQISLQTEQEKTSKRRKLGLGLLFIVVASAATFLALHFTSRSTSQTPPSKLASTADASILVPYTSSRPPLDGSLGGAWSSALKVSLSSPLGSASLPQQATSAYLLWDSDNLYIGASISETDVWGSMRDDNTQLYLENNWELFLDPDSDGLNYYEFEVNPLAYSQGGSPTSPDPLQNLQKAVQVQGTLNNPSDKDQGWSVTLAIPWTSLNRFNSKFQGAPKGNGETIGIQFARTEWGFTVKDGGYVKGGKSDTILWAGMSGDTIHDPSQWGVVGFSGGPKPVVTTTSVVEVPVKPTTAAIQDPMTSSAAAVVVPATSPVNHNGKSPTSAAIQASAIVSTTTQNNGAPAPTNKASETEALIVDNKVLFILHLIVFIFAQ
ncbi:CBD9-like protein [Rhizoclosmatium globosum]|uniref:CBD9-like protein n=1 Tax=Rhizoclosmatium globosum TaxID=329046 RepID=A0A1Y2CEM6_9FUNG|nr:CBD9-like protein [Rhizoclosmatium globosum]|eukprot:ORY45518.1 CBD9-like protein [Rhizoclosmatium globosum]